MALQYPVSDLEYDLLSVLQKKLEGIEAYRTYVEDCRKTNNRECEQLFTEFAEQDRRACERLHEMLMRTWSGRSGAGAEAQRETRVRSTGEA